MKEKIRTAYKTVLDYDAIVRLVILTFIGGVIQTVTFLGTFWNHVVQATITTSYQIPSNELVVITTIYFVISFVYAVLTSSSFSPKRIVSPLHIQIVTAGMLVLLSVFLFYGKDLPTGITELNVQRLFGGLVTYCVLFAIVGWMMRIGIRRIIALNGTKENLVVHTMKYNTNYRNVREALENNELLSEYDLKIIKNDKDSLLMRSTSNTDIRTVVVLKPFGEQCILCVVTYQIKHDSITRTKRAIMRAQHITDFIADDIKYSDEQNIDAITFTEPNDANDKAVELALKKTKSPLRNLPYRLAFSIIGLVVIVVWVWNQRSSGLIDDNTMYGGIIAIITTVILLIVPSLKEKSRDKE